MKRFLSKTVVLAAIAGGTASHAGVNYEQMIIAVCIFAIFGLAIDGINKKLNEISSKLDGKEKYAGWEESENK